MRVSREEALQSRARIVEATKKLMLEHGIDGFAVSDLMRAAGFTQGGFYKHFDSKDSLIAEACEKAFADVQERRWAILLAPASDTDPAWKRFVEAYLSKRHRDNPREGCPLPVFGGDVARHDFQVRRAFTKGFSSLTDLLSRALSGSRAARRKRALNTLACLVGAVSLARAVDDEALSAEILEATARSLT